MLRDKLGNARSSKKDEFYTLYEDVKFELDHYIDQFKDKTIYCPCDTKESAFVKYFLELEAKGLIKELLYTSLKDGVDFLGDGAIDGYKHSDIVVTNPPFSLFRPFISLLDSLDKGFIIWGTNNCCGYKQIATLLVNNKVRLGYIVNKTCEFEVPKGYADDPKSKLIVRDDSNFISVPAISVFTNLNVNRPSKLELTKKLDNTYKKYDNFDAIHCSKTSDIPVDYDGYIGVPLTYLTKHDSEKFKIVGVFNNFSEIDLDHGLIAGTQVLIYDGKHKTRGPVINGKPSFIRLIIQRIK